MKGGVYRMLTKELVEEILSIVKPEAYGREA